MTELASNFTTIFIDFFFVHTNFLNFFFLNLRTKRRQQVIPGGCFYHIDTIVVERKTEKLVSLLKTYFFRENNGFFWGSPNFFFPWGSFDPFFFFFLFF